MLNILQQQIKVLEETDINYQEFQCQIKEMSKYLDLDQNESNRRKSSISQDILSSILVRFNNNTETIWQRVMNQMSKTQNFSSKSKQIDSLQKQNSSISNMKSDQEIVVQNDQQDDKQKQKTNNQTYDQMIEYVLDGFQFKDNRIIVTDCEFINKLKDIVRQKNSLKELQEYSDDCELNYLQYTALQFHSLNIDIDSHDQLVDSLISFIIMNQQARIVKHIPRNVKNQQTLKFKHQKSTYMIQYVDGSYKVYIRNRKFYLIANLVYSMSEYDNHLILKQKGKIQLDVEGQVFKINLGPNYIIDGLYSGQIKYKLKGVIVLSYKVKEQKNLVIIDFSNSINSLENFNVRLKDDAMKVLTNSFMVYHFRIDMILNQLFNIEQIIEIAKTTNVIKFGYGVLFQKYCQEHIESSINWLQDDRIFRKYVFKQ